MEPNFSQMTMQELKQYADYASDWLDERGFTISDVIDLRKTRQDRGVLLGVIWAWREISDNAVAEMNRQAGMRNRVGTEA